MTKDSIMTFGKFKGRTVRRVMQLSPRYLLWAHESVEGFELDPELLEEVILMTRRTWTRFNWEIDFDWDSEDFDIDQYKRHKRD